MSVYSAFTRFISDSTSSSTASHEAVRAVKPLSEMMPMFAPIGVEAAPVHQRERPGGDGGVGLAEARLHELRRQVAHVAETAPPLAARLLAAQPHLLEPVPVLVARRLRVAVHHLRRLAQPPPLRGRRAGEPIEDVGRLEDVHLVVLHERAAHDAVVAQLHARPAVRVVRPVRRQRRRGARLSAAPPRRSPAPRRRRPRSRSAARAARRRPCRTPRSAARSQALGPPRVQAACAGRLLV